MKCSHCGLEGDDWFSIKFDDGKPGQLCDDCFQSVELDIRFRVEGNDVQVIATGGALPVDSLHGPKE